MGDRKKVGELCGSRLPLGLRIESWIPLGDRKKAEELVPRFFFGLIGERIKHV
jgi:hypothetical protein